MNLYQEALNIQETLVNNRNHLHQNPETGLHLPKTAAYVEEKLKEMGYTPRRIGECGLVATVGKPGGKCFLLRSDMDALPVQEQADVEFKSTNGNMHACGHDCHTAALLGAAQLLKAHESELEGMVKLMFQPAEETMDGGKMMIEGGVLEDPKVDAAMSMHVMSNVPLPVGTLLFTGVHSKFAAVDWFTIHVTGKGCHGAQPHNGIDPLNAMAHIFLALQTISAREVDPTQPLVLTIGQMHGGNTSNVIPQEAMMSGTIRTLSNEVRAQVKERIEAITAATAATFGAEARVEYGSGCPVLEQDKELYAQVKEICSGLEGVTVLDADELDMPASGGLGSEDFAWVTNEVPSVFLCVAAGKPEEGYCYPQHHPKVRFHEDALPASAAAFAHVAIQWLKENS